jgi:sRNA-binding protein
MKSNSIARTRAELVQRFPKCFQPRGQAKLPLRVGIFGDIRKAWPEIGWGPLSRALANYTSGPTYLQAIVEGAPRYGLDGAPVGEVDKKQADHAALLFSRIVAEMTEAKERRDRRIAVGQAPTELPAGECQEAAE